MGVELIFFSLIKEKTKTLHMKSFALYNLKGGVGKTTSCVNLAYLAASEGHKTLLWDLDPQSAASFYLRKNSSNGKLIQKLKQKKESIENIIQPTTYNNLFIIPGSLENRYTDAVLQDLKKSKTRLKKLLATIRRDFDYVFIDCPPALSLTAENVFRAADYVLLPMVPSTLSERTYNQVMDFFNHNDYDIRKIVPFFTLVDRRRNLHKDTIARFREDKRKLMRSQIPNSSMVEKMGTKMAPVHQFSPRSTAASAYRDLWQELKWFRKLKPRV